MRNVSFYKHGASLSTYQNNSYRSNAARQVPASDLSVGVLVREINYCPKGSEALDIHSTFTNGDDGAESAAIEVSVGPSA